MSMGQLMYCIIKFEVECEVGLTLHTVGKKTRDMYLHIICY